MKRCYSCQETKPLDEFHRNSGKADGHTSVCKPCACARTRRWHAETYVPGSRKTRAAELLKKYGLTIEAYDALLVKQGGTCGICGAVTEKNLHVDHCHATGAVRGLLCPNCNKALGLMADDPKRLRSAAAYLDKER